MFTPDAIATLAQLNRSALDAWCTVERATRTEQPEGGHVPEWAAKSPELTDLACRVSAADAATGQRERRTGSTVWQAADYVVSLDFAEVDPMAPGELGITIGDRLAVRSGDAAETAWAMTLYVLGHAGPQSYDPWPKVLCTTTPQPGQ